MGVHLVQTFKKLIKKIYTQPPGENFKPENIRNNIRDYARYLFKAHFWRWIRFSTIGIFTTGLGFLILYTTVSGAGLKPIFGYLIENAVMMQIGFLLNRYLTFGDRETYWLKALFKWYGIRASGFGAGQAIFFVLVNIAGLQYMLASLTIAAGLGLFSYAVSNVFAFSPQRLKAQLN
ncbi:MAG TPA: GtrA family protein [Candidatus Saccharimonadales bacterium]|nr:GtrA family protein [Candidatus Saccharimonadales bacterium]